MREYKNISYGELPEQKLDIYLPEGKCKNVFLYFHGGGIEGGNKSDERLIPLFKTVTSGETAVVSANYRMFPAAKYPDFIDDAARCAGWVKEHIAEYTSFENLYVGGSSAGGYLSMMLCFDERWYKPYGISNADITGYIHDAGQPTVHFNVLKYDGVDSRRVIIDERAPLYHIGCFDSYPRMLFIVSDDDMENRYEQTKLVISTLKHFGHTENVELCEMHGGHCHYVGLADENGVSVFGKLILGFIGK